MVSQAVEESYRPLVKVHYTVGLRSKLDGEGSCECLERLEVRNCDPSIPPRKTQWAGRKPPGPLLGLPLRAKV